MKRFLASFSALLMLVFAAPVMAAGGAFEISDFARTQDGLDQVFTFTVRNVTENDAVANGRLIVLNVYDTSHPTPLAVNNLAVPAQGSVKASVRWPVAPLLGQIRALLVLNAGPGTTTVEDFVFWIFPWEALLILIGALLVTSGITLALIRFISKRRSGKVPEGPGGKKDRHLKKGEETRPQDEEKEKRRRKRYPSGMTGYTVEFGDTVVTVASRFGVTWEDVVRANRLKPPYPLKPGKEILIPVHDLRRPEGGEGES